MTAAKDTYVQRVTECMSLKLVEIYTFMMRIDCVPAVSFSIPNRSLTVSGTETKPQTEGVFRPETN